MAGPTHRSSLAEVARADLISRIPSWRLESSSESTLETIATHLALAYVSLLRNFLLDECKKDKPIQPITSAPMPRLDIHGFMIYHVRRRAAKVIDQGDTDLSRNIGKREPSMVMGRVSTGSRNKTQARGSSKPRTKEPSPTYELGNIVSSCPLHVWRPGIFRTSGYYPAI